MMGRIVGVVILLISATMLGYFWLAFDISRPTHDFLMDRYSPYYFAPGRAVNEGLMNDRLVGTLVSGAIGFAGLMVWTSAKIRPRTGWKRGPSPQPPLGFNFDLSFAMHYAPRPNGKQVMPRTSWTRAIGNLANVSAYRSDQIEWAYEMGVDPRNFESYIAYIEEYRSWQFSGGLVRVE